MVKVRITVLVLAIFYVMDDVRSEDASMPNLEDLFKPLTDELARKTWDDERRQEAKESIRYLLYDREGQTWKEMAENGTVPDDIWEEDGDIKLLIHSYSAQVTVPDSMKVLTEQNILEIGLVYGKKNESINIIVVDWTALATDTSDQYNEIVKNVKDVAGDISDFLRELNMNGNLKDMSNVHIIGLGLGAHVAGVVGRLIDLDDMDDAKIGRITGLDPIGPGFADDEGKEYVDNDKALTKGDADFVDIIHCNMGKSKDFTDAMVKAYFGSSVQSGDVDFYPNGGKQQTGCKPFDEVPESPCSQRNCSSYFALSIKKKFLGCPCDDYELFQKGVCECKETGGAFMGEQCCPEKAKGKYYLNIRKEDVNDDNQDKMDKQKEQKDKRKDMKKGKKNKNSVINT